MSPEFTPPDRQSGTRHAPVRSAESRQRLSRGGSESPRQPPCCRSARSPASLRPCAGPSVGSSRRERETDTRIGTPLWVGAAVRLGHPDRCRADLSRRECHSGRRAPSTSWPRRWRVCTRRPLGWQCLRPLEAGPPMAANAGVRAAARSGTCLAAWAGVVGSCRPCPPRQPTKTHAWSSSSAPLALQRREASRGS